MSWTYQNSARGWIRDDLDLVVLFLKEIESGQLDLGKWAYTATVKKIGTRIIHAYTDTKEAAIYEVEKATRIYLLGKVKKLQAQADIAADTAGIFELAQQGHWDKVGASLRAMSWKDVREFGGVVERLEYGIWSELEARKKGAK
jgi:hypothetical protein